MDKISRWKLADELTPYQIALLISGYDPSEFESDHPDRWPEEVRRDISPFLNAIKNVARSGRVEMTPVTFENGYDNDINWLATTVNIDSLCEWMRRRNFYDGFFMIEHEKIDELVNPSGEYYAPKLAAAVRAWNETTSSSESLNGKTPKKALEIWLRKHANEYGLTGKDGNPNELGIEEICKVSNWKPGGGATPTPSKISLPPGQSQSEGRKVKPRPTTLSKRPAPCFGRMTDLDDDIPF